MTGTWAIIPSRSRPRELADLVTRLLAEDARGVVVVDNGYEAPRRFDDERVTVLHDDEQPPNLSRMWNTALDEVSRRTRGVDEWNVALLNDDAGVPPGWVAAVTTALRSNGAAAACTGPVNRVTLKTAHDRELATRMCPWAFVLRGELGLRADERLRWWWGDTDLDWQARLAGGVVIIPGHPVTNAYANSTTTGELLVQSGRDGEEFARKWGSRPW